MDKVTKVEVNLETLMEFLDQHEGGKLYPKLGKDDRIIRVNLNPITAEFVLANRHSPYTLKK